MALLIRVFGSPEMRLLSHGLILACIRNLGAQKLCIGYVCARGQCSMACWPLHALRARIHSARPFEVKVVVIEVVPTDVAPCRVWVALTVKVGVLYFNQSLESTLPAIRMLDYGPRVTYRLKIMLFPSNCSPVIPKLIHCIYFKSSIDLAGIPLW